MKRAWAGLALFAAVTLPGCGEGSGSAKSRTASDPFTAVSRESSLTQTARRAAPRWERVGSFDGTADRALPIEIHARAIQWRARWRCSTGNLALAVEPKPRTAAERPGGRCPDKGEATWVQTGKQQLRVRGGGRWSVVVEQQVDTPLHEPALPSMRASGTRVLASGSFYPVERKGTGRARLYRLADGRGALRLDPFRTSSNTDLYVWFSTAPRPKTTKQVVAARRLGPLLPLKSTIGEQNYVLPRSVDPRRVRSIVIWCVPVQIVYTVAGLS
ncbi:MAG TPA: DM13 domain-containing protein [Solirubrobacteraceae bacterium]|nr:DM13 domain-containing protein [Solirubrobacteraceae bacterium]